MSLFKPFVLKTRLAYKYAKRHLPPSLGFLSLHSRKPGVLPSFLIAGAMKSGTSSLYTYLSQHPGILPASRKEIHYLNNFPVSTKGNRYYRGNFPNQNEIDEVSQKLGYQAQTGEATPTMHLHAYPIGASSLIPDAKCCVIPWIEPILTTSTIYIQDGYHKKLALSRCWK